MSTNIPNNKPTRGGKVKSIIIHLHIKIYLYFVWNLFLVHDGIKEFTRNWNALVVCHIKCFAFTTEKKVDKLSHFGGKSTAKDARKMIVTIDFFLFVPNFNSVSRCIGRSRFNTDNVKFASQRVDKFNLNFVIWLFHWENG